MHSEQLASLPVDVKQAGELSWLNKIGEMAVVSLLINP
ncbi:MAG: hypothetical protein OFPII_10240 [Osedax symbiont Rs1]|nr:MAG: hypothetical protein OFPII_10240 [Osedax symbiont Rs1]